MIPSIVLNADEALERVASSVELGASMPEVLVWGPGETLLSATTFDILRRMAWHYPGLPLTVCTNGLLLTDRLDELVRASVRNVLLMIPALMPRTAAKVYVDAAYRARRYTGEAAATLVLQQQWSGLLNAIEAGISVSVAIPVIPGVNEHEVTLIGQRAQELGADRVLVSELSLPTTAARS
jgi:nitrogen fixation protein NifB